MFIRSSDPSGVLFHQGQYPWDPTAETAFAFDFANPDLFLRQNLQTHNLLRAKQLAFSLGLTKMAPSHGNLPGAANGHRLEAQQYRQHGSNNFDQSLVWFQNMEDPNDAFRELSGCHPPTPASFNVSLTSSDNNTGRGSIVQAHRHLNFIPDAAGPKPKASSFNPENPWLGTALTPSDVDLNHFSQPANPQASHRWPGVPGSRGNCIQAYNLPGIVSHGLPVYAGQQSVGPPFGPAVGGVPNLDSSSTSSHRVDGGSPNTVFGSFSSSIGPPDLMDMDATDECFHSPSIFPADGMPLCHNPGSAASIPQAFLSTSPAHGFSVAPPVTFPEAETVSPSMLRLRHAPSLPSSSSSESLHTPFRMDSDSDGAPPPGTAAPHGEILPSSAWQARRESGSRLNQAGRKQLPDKAPRAGPVPLVPSNGPKRRHGGDAAIQGQSSAPSSKKSRPNAKDPPQPQAKTQSSSHHHHRSHPSSHHSSHPGAPNPRGKPHGKPPSSAVTSPSPNAAATDASATPSRSDRDEFLVRSKLAGMTYKEIRRQGGFTEAESTLRGRFRTLTKPKEARVRKPEFKEIDDKLLRRAVPKLTKDAGGDITRDNVPWKLVAEYMASHGGSYFFGYTTVRKRWEYLMVTSDEQVHKDRLDHRFQT